MAGDRELFDKLIKEPALRRLKDSFHSQYLDGLWCFVPKSGAGPKQQKSWMELSFQVWSDPRANQKARMKKVFAAVQRRGKDAQEAFQMMLPDSTNIAAAPVWLQDRLFGYLAVAELKVPVSKSAFAPFAHCVKLFAENLWKTEELSRLSATIRPRAIALSTVHTVHRIINSTLNLNELVSRLAHLTAQVLRVQRCSLYLIDGGQRKTPSGTPLKKNWLICKALVGYPKKDQKERRVRMGQGLEGRVAKTAEIQLRKKVLCVPLIDEDVIGVVTVIGKKDKKEFDHFDLEILTTLAEEAVIAIKNAQLYEEQRRVTLNTIQSLAVVLGSRLPHQALMTPEAFAKLALKMAEALGLNDEQTQALQYAALLKETTKIGIPDEILKKPSKLTGEELTELQRHTIHGAKLVQNFESLKTVAPIILYSREKFDGTGYPEGLKGEAIPIGARILAVMNAFEAIVIGRPYRGQSTQDEALSELMRNSGSQFDPSVVEAFVRIMRRDGVAVRQKHASGA
jgi:response regulator RpfG family c-di-GMP phosphodiesterase